MKGTKMLLKRFGAFALTAGLVLGTLAVTAQPAAAAAKFKFTTQSYTKQYKMDDGTVYYETTAKLPKLKGSSDAVKKINKALTKTKKEWIASAKTKVDEYQEQYEEILEYNKDAESPIPWYFGDSLDYTVTANNKDYFSVLMEGYEFTGGAHGMPYRICLTFDASTGKKLSAAKLLGVKASKVNDRVSAMYLAKYDKEGVYAGFYAGDDEREMLENGLKNLDFKDRYYVKGKKVVFFSYPYDLGPYASGFIEVSATAKK